MDWDSMCFVDDKKINWESEDYTQLYFTRKALFCGDFAMILRSDNVFYEKGPISEEEQERLERETYLNNEYINKNDIAKHPTMIEVKQCWADGKSNVEKNITIFKDQYSKQEYITIGDLLTERCVAIWKNCLENDEWRIGNASFKLYDMQNIASDYYTESHDASQQPNHIHWLTEKYPNKEKLCIYGNTFWPSVFFYQQFGTCGYKPWDKSFDILIQIEKQEQEMILRLESMCQEQYNMPKVIIDIIKRYVKCTMTPELDQMLYDKMYVGKYGEKEKAETKKSCDKSNGNKSDTWLNTVLMHGVKPWDDFGVGALYDAGLIDHCYAANDDDREDDDYYDYNANSVNDEDDVDDDDAHGEPPCKKPKISRKNISHDV